MRLKEEYNDKNEFIRDFIKLCRLQKYSYRGGCPTFRHKFIGICGEFWSFCIYIDGNGIYTEAILYLDDGKKVKYPKTKWGEPYIRWDSDLRAFLAREICKQ